MSTSKEGGNKPNNLGLSDFKVLPERRGIGPRDNKSEIPMMDTPSDKAEEQPKRPLKRWHRGAF